MVRVECGCGHILYESSSPCPICGRSLKGAPISSEAFHELGTEPGCTCYKYREKDLDNSSTDLAEADNNLKVS